MKLIYFTSLIILLFSCTVDNESNLKNNTKTKEITLKKSRQLTNYADSIFFTKILDIEIIDQKYYFADFDQNKVYIFDEVWDFVGLFGAEGPGPAEFDGLSNISHNQNLIGVSDLGSSSIKIFNKDHQFIKSVRMPYSIETTLEFAIDNLNVFYQSSNRYELLSKYDSASNILSTYGYFKKDFTLSTKDRNNYQTNQWHTLLSKENLFVINFCEPLVLVYDMDSNEKVGSYDLSEVEALQKRLKYVNNKINSDPHTNTNFILFSDVVVKGKDIYLLITNHDEQKNKVLVNQVLHLRLLDNSQFEEVAVYQLNPYGWYETFAINDDKLIAFDGYASAIEEYILEQ